MCYFKQSNFSIINPVSHIGAHKIVSLDSSKTTSAARLALLDTLGDAFLLFAGNLVLQVRLHTSCRPSALDELWIENTATLTIGVVCALLNDIVSLSSGSTYAEDRSTRLHLLVNELDLFFDFFEHLREASLLENGLCFKQVLFGLLRLWWIINHVQGADHFERLGDVQRAVTVQGQLELLKEWKDN